MIHGGGFIQSDINPCCFPNPRLTQKTTKPSAEARPTERVAVQVIRNAAQMLVRLARRAATEYKLRPARRATLARSRRRWSAGRPVARRRASSNKGHQQLWQGVGLWPCLRALAGGSGRGSGSARRLSSRRVPFEL